MNKKFILSASLILLIGFAVFVSAFTGLGNEYHQQQIRLEKGWNLVSLYTFQKFALPQENTLSDWQISQLKEKGISAVFIFDSYNKEYIRTYPQTEVDKLSQFRDKLLNAKQNENIGEFARWVNSAIWVYSDNSQSFEFGTTDGPFYINNIDLKSGWNILTITPDLVGKRLDKIKGECQIEKAYFWNLEDKKWEGDILNEYISSEGLWYGIAIKVSNNCKLGESVTNPPQLP